MDLQWGAQKNNNTIGEGSSYPLSNIIYGYATTLFDFAFHAPIPLLITQNDDTRHLWPS